MVISATTSFAQFEMKTFTPYTFEYKGIDPTSFENALRKMEKHEEDTWNTINNYCMKAEKFIQEKEYSLAIFNFKQALATIDRYRLPENFKETKKNIQECLEWCKKKAENPDDNPYYRCEFSTIPGTSLSIGHTYGYGINDELKFLIFEFGVSASWYLTPNQAIEFVNILNDLKKSLTIKTNPQIKSKVYPRKFPMTVRLYTMNKVRTCFAQDFIDIQISYNQVTKKYAGCIFVSYSDYPLMVIEKETDISFFIENIKNCMGNYRLLTKEKVRDNDSFLQWTKKAGL